MGFEVKYHESNEIVETEYTGVLSAAEIHEAATKRIAMQKQTGATRVLLDASKFETTASIIDIYNIPSKTYIEQDAPHNCRIALVSPIDEEAKKLASFFETAAVNRGWPVQTFISRQEAIDWLISD